MVDLPLRTTGALLLALVCAGAAADTQIGLEALGRGNYDRALNEFRPAAEQGDWSAQSYLAHTYQLMENYEQAYAWFHASAECGSADARIDRSLLAAKMSPARITRAERIGRDYYLKYCNR